MLYRKIESLIEEHLKSDSKKILLIDGARQIGKTYIINYVGNKLFENYIEINMIEDSLGDRLFENTKTVEDFYLQVSMLAGDKMKSKESTLIFIDEIQAYPHLLTLLKFLSQDNKFTYIASGSLLGVTLSQTTSIPMGSIRKVRMYPLDFEEFLYANGMNELAVSSMRKKFERLEALDESMHNKMLDLFRKFLLVGGLPDAVNAYLETKNIQAVRDIQNEIQIIKRRHADNPLDHVRPVMDGPMLLSCQRAVEQVYIHDAVYEYIAQLVNATRKSELIKLGVSPRGTLALCRMAKSGAFLAGRDYVLPDDVAAIFKDVAAHRLILDARANIAGCDARSVLENILASVAKPVPR